MQCSQCRHENPAEAKFCLNCGTRLAQVCSQCQQVLPPEAKFCMACGHALTATSTSDAPGPPPSGIESAPPARHTPEAERRQLTVMFCDLVGSTALSGRLDPEELRDVIRAYQSTSTEVIEHYDGYIAQHLGDGLMVYFGWPQAHEDDAQRAVRASLGVVDAMGPLNERLDQDKGVRLAVRIGIHTGPVVIGEIGSGASQEQLALGETPNVAARIQGLAEADTVVVSAAAYGLVQGYFDCEDLGDQELRGVAGPLGVYRVLRESGAQSRLEITPILTPLVGREQEVGLLLDRWDQAQASQGQVVMLSGEAGIGKSRLVQVLKDHVAKGLHTRLESRSSPYYQNTALYPVIDLIQRALGWEQNDSTDEQLGKLEQAMSQYRLPVEETVPLMAGLLSLSLPEGRYAPLHLTAQRQRQKTLETIVTIILERAEHEPVLFILEDLHWTDPSTLELLDVLVEQTPTAQLCVLLTCRPEFQSQWANRSYFTQVTLNRLSREGIEQMTSQVAEGKTLPSEVLQQLIEKTDGVPLYVEEMTKAVLESDVLKEANGHYELSGPISSLAIPATLQDSLMSRLDRLVTAKAVAQYASVIGRQFSYELLQAVAQLDETRLQHELGRLVEAELVYPRGVAPGAIYIFKHALIQNTAYETLLRRTRQQYHAQIAHALESQFPDTTETQPELLAHHYSEAGRIEQAITYWQRAGQRASERSAYVEASHHLSKGLEVLRALPPTPERAQHELMLQLTLGGVLTVTKGHAAPEVGCAFNRARELCEHTGDTEQLFPVLRGLWEFYELSGDLQTAQELGEQLLQLAQDAQDRARLVVAHGVLGDTLFWRGEFVASHSNSDQGCALYEPSLHHALTAVYGGYDPGVMCHLFAGFALWYLGYPDQAAQRSQETLLLAQELSHLYSLAYALLGATWVHQLRQDGDVPLEQVETALTLCTEQEFAFLLSWGIILRGRALFTLGQEAEGIGRMEQGLVAWRATGAQGWQAVHLGALAEAYRLHGRPGEGLERVTEGLALVNATGERFFEAELHRLQGELVLSLVTPDDGEAEACFHQALVVARQQQAKLLEIRTAISLARLWQSQGKRGEAYKLLAPIYNWFTEGFDTADLQEAKDLLDDLSTQGSTPTAPQEAR